MHLACELQRAWYYLKQWRQILYFGNGQHPMQQTKEVLFITENQKNKMGEIKRRVYWDAFKKLKYNKKL